MNTVHLFPVWWFVFETWNSLLKDMDGRYINVTKLASRGISITIALEAKESLPKHTFITNFISNLLMNQTYLF